MAPRSSRASGADTDTSMADHSEPIRQLAVDPMVCLKARFFMINIRDEEISGVALPYANQVTGC